MSVDTILEAVRDAFAAFKSSYTPSKTAKELFAAFTDSLDASLGE